MSSKYIGTGDLFGDEPTQGRRTEPLADGAVILRGFAGAESRDLMQELQGILEAAPFRHMITPGGFRMSVAMTNCGLAGWVSDERGYRYDSTDPTTGAPWPPMPDLFRRVARNAAVEAGYSFDPDACLINRYEPGTRLSLHQDRNERDFDAPIVSFSLGLPAVFLFGSTRRRGPVQRTRLESGDAAVWGGPSRLAFHGIATLAEGDHPLTGRYRINLTFRKAL
jgi:alkylated DNA repair protein (DNA oxidative demethylase)